MDRRDLLSGINDFFSDSIVLPPGDFDKELLLPIIETAKIKNNNIKRRSVRRKNLSANQSNESTHTTTSPQCKFQNRFFFLLLLTFVFFYSYKIFIR